MYWSESPKAKFIKQGEVEQVNIIFTDNYFSVNFLTDNDRAQQHLQDSLTDITVFRFRSPQSWPWVTRRWSGLSKTRWALPPNPNHRITSDYIGLFQPIIREGSKKKIRKKGGLLPNRGGGPEVYIKNQPPSVIMYFLKWACKTILGPLKHVLHLVWSVYVTSKAIKTALKVELLRFFFTLDASPWLGQIMVSKKKKSKIFFLLKICFRHYRSIFHQKKSRKKFSPENWPKKTKQGGGGGIGKRPSFSGFFFATFP